LSEEETLTDTVTTVEEEWEVRDRELVVLFHYGLNEGKLLFI
jgi:hypothetical protein